MLGLSDRDGLAAGWGQLHCNISRARPGLVLDGILVEVMSQPGVELIIGGRNDLDWGPIVLAGFGGVQAELLRDVRINPSGPEPPIRHRGAQPPPMRRPPPRLPGLPRPRSRGAGRPDRPIGTNSIRRSFDPRDRPQSSYRLSDRSRGESARTPSLWRSRSAAFFSEGSLSRRHSLAKRGC